MAATFGTITDNLDGNQREVNRTITGDTSYTTGGYAIAPSVFGFGAITGIQFTPFGTGTTCYVGYWDNTNNKVKFMKSQAGLLIEETATTDVHLFGFVMRAQGT